MNENKNNQNTNEKDNQFGLGLGEWTYIDNPSWIVDEHAPKRFFVKNWGNSIEITPRWQ